MGQVIYTGAKNLILRRAAANYQVKCGNN
jgi:hypothetical protein